MKSNKSVINQENPDRLENKYREEVESYINEYEYEEGTVVPNKKNYITRQIDLVVRGILGESYDPEFDFNDLDSFPRDFFRDDIYKHGTMYNDYTF